MKRQRHDPDHIKALLARRDEEGLTFQQLGEESGIPFSTLAAWSRKLRQPKAKPGFVELQVEEPRSQPSIWIEAPNGFRVGVTPGFDGGTLARVLRALPC